MEACGFWKEERAHPVRGQLIHRKFAGSDGDGCFAAFQSLELVPADFWNIQVGGDVYSANRDAVRTIRRRDNGMLMFEDQMWPDATITATPDCLLVPGIASITSFIGQIRQF